MWRFFAVSACRPASARFARERHGRRCALARLEPVGVLEKSRVVITGLGAVTPLGNSVQEFWEGLLAGRSGVGPVTAFNPVKLTTRIAAEVKDFDAAQLIGRKEARRMDRYAHFAMVAAREAWADARLPDDPDVRARTGAIIASGIGGIITVEETTLAVGPTERWDRISPFFVPMLMANAASAQVSMEFGLRGPVFAISSACASGNDAIVAAYDKIVLGEAIAVVTGGSEATVIATAMGGFCTMKAMSTRNDDPAHASRPVRRRPRRLRAGRGRRHHGARGPRLRHAARGARSTARSWATARPPTPTTSPSPTPSRAA